MIVRTIAIAALAAAAALAPSKLHFVAAEVEVLTMLGRLDEADARIASVERAFEFSPVIDRLRADVAKVRGDHVRCADLLERARVRDTASPQLVEELAFARYSKGDWSGSLAALEDPVLAPAASRPDLVRLRARNLILLGRPAEARDALVAIRDQPDPEGRTALLLGHAAWRLGDWGRVRACGEELLRRRPEIADGYMFLGACAQASGRLDEGLAMFEQAVAREPEREMVQRLVAGLSGRGQRGPDAAAAGAVRSPVP